MNVIELPVQYKKINNPNAYDNLTDYEKQHLHDWITTYLDPCSTKGYSDYYPSSYRLKHYFEWYGGFYVSNGAFKGAMLQKGYMPKNYNQLNWTFQIGKRADNPKHYKQMAMC